MRATSSGRLFWSLQLLVWSLYGLFEYGLLRLSPLPLPGMAEMKSVALPLVLVEAGTLFATTSAIGLQLRRRLPRMSSYRRAVRESASALALWLPLGLASDVLLTLPFLGSRDLLAAWGLHGLLPYVYICVTSSIMPGLTILVWTAAYLVGRLLRENLVERENVAKARTLAVDAQLQALRYQLNPHFLFNSLSALRGLIHEDPTRAEQMVCELADFLRSALHGGPERVTSVPLSEELALARTYLSIEKVRFEEALLVDFSVAPEMESAQVPPFVLNPLVENAVRYGHRTSPSPLQLTVTAQRDHESLCLCVSNTGKILPPGDGSGSGIGLRNVRERLELLYPGRHSLDLREDAGWVHVTVTLPCELTTGRP